MLAPAVLTTKENALSSLCLQSAILSTTIANIIIGGGHGLCGSPFKVAVACKILDNFTILAPSAFLISQEMDGLLAMPLQAFPFIETQRGRAVVSNSAIDDAACRS